MQEIAQTVQTTQVPARITVQELKKKLDAGEHIFFLDTRNARDWGESTVKLPGARRIHFSELPKRLNEVPHDRLVACYCTWHDEASSARAAQILLDNGYVSVCAMKGGFNAWRDAGYPLEPKE